MSCQDLRSRIRRLFFAEHCKGRTVDAELIAFDGRLFQVLSLPPTAVRRAPKRLGCEQDFAQEEPATVRQLMGQSLAQAARSQR